MKKKIIILGCMDTKGQEYAFIKDIIEKAGCDTLLIDVGVIDPPMFKHDISRQEAAKAAVNSITDRSAPPSLMSTRSIMIAIFFFTAGLYLNLTGRQRVRVCRVFGHGVPFDLLCQEPF